MNETQEASTKQPHHFLPQNALLTSCLLCVCFQVSFFLFIVFVVYTMLPFSMRGAIIASAVTCTSHTVTLSVFLAAKVTELEPLVWQVSGTAADS